METKEPFFACFVSNGSDFLVSILEKPRLSRNGVSRLETISFPLWFPFVSKKTSIGGKLETNGACGSFLGDIAPPVNGDMAFPFGTLGQLGNRALGASHFLRDVSARVETVLDQADENLHRC